MNNIMIDIETLGLEDTCVITSLAAVQFNIESGKTGREFYMTIEAQGQLNIGRTVSILTIKWWMEQDPKVRDEMFNATEPLENVLHKFQFWFRGLKNPTLFESDNTVNHKDIIKVWGNSARFDLSKLQSAYHILNMEVPWNDRSNERCYRTYAKDFGDEVHVEDDPTLKSHLPVHDCKRQIKKLCAIWKYLTGYQKEKYEMEATYAEALRFLFRIRDNNSPAIAVLRDEVIYFLNNPQLARSLASSDYRWTPNGPVHRGTVVMDANGSHEIVKDRSMTDQEEQSKIIDQEKI